MLTLVPCEWLGEGLGRGRVSRAGAPFVCSACRSAADMVGFLLQVLVSL